MDIALLLNELAAPDVSDILLEAGMFPALRVNSELRFLRERPRIEAADDTPTMLRSLLNEPFLVTHRTISTKEPKLISINSRMARGLNCLSGLVPGIPAL